MSLTTRLTRRFPIWLDGRLLSSGGAASMGSIPCHSALGPHKTNTTSRSPSHASMRNGITMCRRQTRSLSEFRIPFCKVVNLICLTASLFLLILDNLNICLWNLLPIHFNQPVQNLLAHVSLDRDFLHPSRRLCD